MARVRAFSSRFYGDKNYGAPQSYFTDGPPRGPREAFLPSSDAIHPSMHSDRAGNRGFLFAGDDDNPNDDDYMLYHTHQMRGWSMMPEEQSEVIAERKRRAEARADVCRVEKARAKADVARAKFHTKDEIAETCKMDLRDAQDADDGSRISALKVQVADLKLRQAQEECISRESVWLGAELQVEIEMAEGEMRKMKRYEVRNAAREKIEKVRAGKAIAAAGHALRTGADL